jgi:hypothetical protein
MREPQLKAQYLPVMDEIIHETLKIEQQDGIYEFLMSYAKDRQPVY